MAFGEAIPPFSFPGSDSGIEIDVIGEALAYHGHKLAPRYLPLARVPINFRQKSVDAAMTDLGIDMTAFGAYYGNSAVIYDNVFISLEERELTISQPQDLNRLSVLSFNGAVRRYPEWLNQVADANLYIEQNNQMLQVLTLDKRRFDLALSDINIFKYNYLQAKQAGKYKLKPVVFHHFTDVDAADYRPVFWSAKIRDDFNDGLQQLKQSGRYQAIYDKYLQPATAE
ncbi:MAG: ABC transporter substrate-binding protein [Motiliproteus sp.]